MVNFGLLTTEICWRVWGTPYKFQLFNASLEQSDNGEITFSVLLARWRLSPAGATAASAEA